LNYYITYWQIDLLANHPVRHEKNLGHNLYVLKKKKLRPGIRRHFEEFKLYKLIYYETRFGLKFDILYYCGGGGLLMVIMV